jgi:hypothetical protein
LGGGVISARQLDGGQQSVQVASLARFKSRQLRAAAGQDELVAAVRGRACFDPCLG